LGEEGRRELMRRPPAVARVLERVTKTAREHEMFREGDGVLVSVSGGPDSVCLLYSLSHLRRLFKIRLEVFHFDHRLRKDSAKDAEYVRRLAGRMKLPFHLRAAGSDPDRRMSPEHWAREVRLRAAASVARERDARRIATGHTLDDQAETVLMAVLTGSGLDAVAGIKPTRGPYVRPLLDVTRADVESFCRSIRVRPRIDATNRDTRLLRNALRLRGLPALERAVGRELSGPLARTGTILREDAQELAGQAAAAEELIQETSDGIRIPVDRLSALPKAIASRVLRTAMFRCWTPPLRENVETLLDLVQGRPGRRADLGRGLMARREREYVSLSRTSPESRE
jgi:tRNA(Ile)-lysidine synthase